MRLDHVAYRVRDRYKTAKFIENTLGYAIGTEFEIDFDDGSKAECIALTPPESRPLESRHWVNYIHLPAPYQTEKYEVHSPPEIFVSDGPGGSIVGDWVAARDGGGLHHVAYQVKDIQSHVNKFRDSGVEFLSDDIINCPEDDLQQIFSKPIPEMGGIIIELIDRGEKGFCVANVKDLMNSTKGL